MPLATNSKSALPTALVRTCAIVALPFLFLIASIVLRSIGGADWLWRIMDPDYYYLFDGLNIATLMPPNHIGHPGVPLSVLVGVVLRVLHPTLGSEELAARVIGDPEFYLDVAATTLIGLNAVAILAAGAATWSATRDAVAVGLVQLGPALSTLTVHNALYVRPEALFVAATMAAAALMMVAVRRDAERPPPGARLAAAFGICAGFVAATKVVAAPLFALLPIFVLGTVRMVAVAWVAAAIAAVVVFLPAVTEVGRFLDWIVLLAKGSGAYGAGAEATIDPASYLWNFRRTLVRPAVAAPLVLGLAALAAGYVKLRNGSPVRTAELKGLAGALLATVAHALLVAKQPSGHYMIPAFCLSGLTLALAYRVACDPRWWSEPLARRLRLGVAALLALAVAAQGFAMVRLGETVRRFNIDASAHAALSSDRCAEIFFYTASNPDYALLMGHYQGGYRFGEAVSARIAQTSFYIRDWFPYEQPDVRNARGSIPLKAMLAQFPCVAFRGGHPEKLTALLRAEGLADLKFDAVCRAPYETAYVIGASCTVP